MRSWFSRKRRSSAGLAPAVRASAAWDLTSLLTAADASASLAERHLWLVRLMEWLRHAPLPGALTPTPVLRLRHLLNVIERQPAFAVQVKGLLHHFWREVDTAALLADFGFSPRMDLIGELGQRLRIRLLPATPETTDLAELFNLLFPKASDAEWLDAMDEATLVRVAALFGPAEGAPQDAPSGIDWQEPFLDAIMFLSASVRAAGFSPLLRARMNADLLVDAPFRQLARVAEDFREHAEAGERAAMLEHAARLRALLAICRLCVDSVRDHLEAHGVSVDLVFELDQLRLRTHRIEALLGCMLSAKPGPEVARLLATLVRTAEARRSVRQLLASQYSLLARKVAERSAETGENYITRDRKSYFQMLRAAAGGGMVIAVTTLLKFFIMLLGLTAFWAGFAAGVNYAVSFVFIQLMHWTVATKQPAMTAPAMAEKLRDLSDDAAVEGFVDEVAHLIRSQAAGILGNVALVAPLALAAQLLSTLAFGQPLVGPKPSEYVLNSLTLLGPTALFAALTGVLLFVSSIIAGWAENWFVWHRLDSAIAWNPRIVARLGTARAQRWAHYWRHNISGFASNISLGLMLGLVPAVAAFFGLPLEVRHVTLSAGQLGAAAGALGLDVLQHTNFWWCVAGIGVTALLNVSVSFFLAFRVALRSRGIRLSERSRIYRAIRRRIWLRPLSFIAPPRSAK